MLGIIIAGFNADILDYHSEPKAIHDVGLGIIFDLNIFKIYILESQSKFNADKKILTINIRVKCEYQTQDRSQNEKFRSLHGLSSPLFKNDTDFERIFIVPWEFSFVHRTLVQLTVKGARPLFSLNFTEQTVNTRVNRILVDFFVGIKV
ncbi:hypothetical protein ES703_70573 [subsurface metagenome]